MATEWSGLLNTTINKYLKGASDGTLRKRLLLAMLRSKAKIAYGRSGNNLDWAREYLEHDLQSFGYGSSMDFAPLDRIVRMVLDWRGYKMTDAMHDKERLMNRGAEALIDRYADMTKSMAKNMENKFCAELYIDGNATGNENRIHGFDSFTGTGTTVAADLIAEPSDTYAGQSTVLGTKGGTWTTALSTKPNANVATDWPSGTGSSQYDYNTPKLLNWSSTNWGTGATTWEANCERVLRKGIMWSAVTGGKDGVPDLFLMSGEMYNGFANHWAAKQRILVPHKESSDLGFGEVLNFEGMGCTYDYDVPDANSGYGWNLDQIELNCLYDTLFRAAGPELEFRTEMWLTKIGFFGNLKFENLKGQFKTKNYA